MNDVYLGTVDRLEGNLHPVDQDASIASIAISLKRIADALDLLQRPAVTMLLDMVEKEAAEIAARV